MKSGIWKATILLVVILLSFQSAVYSIDSDCTRLYFTDGTRGSWSIYTTDLDGNMQQLTDTSMDAYFESVSQNGVLLIASQDGQLDIFVMDLDGENITRITADPANDFSPVWHPEGHVIAFGSDRNNEYGRPQVFQMNIDGTQLIQLSDIYASPSSWSRDGRYLAVTRFTYDDPENPGIATRTEPWLLEVETGKVSPLYTDEAMRGWDPVFSPDDTRIAFVNRDNLHIIHLDTMLMETINFANIGVVEVDYNRVIWGDNTSLYFVGIEELPYLNFNFNIYRYAFDDHSIIQVVTSLENRGINIGCIHDIEDEEN